MEKVTKVEDKNLDWLLDSISINAEEVPSQEVEITALTEQSKVYQEDNARLMGGLSLLMANYQHAGGKGYNKQMTQDLIEQIDTIINNQVNEIIKNETFRDVESQWLAVADLVENTNFRANIKIDLFDVSKEELELDFDCNSVDITGSELFKKIYFAEYDQFGGNPYASLLGLYDFENTPEDISFLSTVGKIATTCHAPFIGSVAPSFFGIKDIKELQDLKDLDGMMKHPRYRRWNKLRDTEQAAYLGLTLPRYMVREPWDPENSPAGKTLRNFKENIDPLDDTQYAWGYATMLFARNLTRSFEKAGWCQYIRGPKGGGLIEELPMHMFNVRGKEEVKAPVQCILPDNKELSLAKAGFIPLIYEKNSPNACFFSTQSLKAPKEFKDPRDTENSQLVTNLAYTYSVARIAHYVKEVGRLNIGSQANDEYLSKILNEWISQYVTEVVDPSPATVSFYPFKKAQINIEKIDGQVGWYKCTFTVLPHIQFEGMDVSLSLDTRLDAS
ncbi:type VI secretion system contractile sheath large subunit [Lentisphaerota bacterium ZTH]|nr:type VI secretion system contractile sheath large subunit [Lentisphaerota bacterium]WET05679.1 type VI secretion system contractile sheath large subunit [Lentisphaerota bacterium ZTH]